MNLTSRAALRHDVMAAESYRQFPYFDCCGKPFRQCRCARQGKLTVGYGRNLEDVGLSKLEAEVLLDHDLTGSELSCQKAFEWFPTLSDRRQRAITELVFNMGIGKFREFRQTIQAIKAGQFIAASIHLLASKWKVQVGPTRSNRIARYLRDAE